MSGDKRYAGPTDLLAHFLPHSVLQELHQHAVSFQGDEQFRIYLLRRLWFVIPFAIVSVLIGSACAIGAIQLLFRFVGRPAPDWLVTAIFGIGVVFWFASILSQLYALLAWLHRRAFSRPPASALPLALIGIFVALPLILFALISPQMALILAAVGICAPVVISLLDRP